MAKATHTSDDHEVDGPLELGVLLRLRDAERQGDGGGDDDELPAPQVDVAQQIARHAGLQQALRRVVDAGEDHIADEGEDDGVGVQRAQTTERQFGQHIELREGELGGDDDAHQHADDAPQHREAEELPDDVVVVMDLFHRLGVGGR
jgi:hypothetical protein